MPAPATVNVRPLHGDGTIDLTVITVSFNTRELTCTAIESLLDSTKELNLQTIVIDNASADGSADEIAKRFPEVHLIRSERNLGFGLANNSAARLAKGRYLLLLNSDTEVPPGAVDRLLEFAKRRPEAGVWGGRTTFADGKLNLGSCWAEQSLWSLLAQALGLTSLFRRSTLFNPEGMGGWPRDEEREVAIVSGCFLLIERRLWEQLGGFSPEFFMYGEDADLCLRARTLGARPAITPDATIVHHGGASERVAADKLVRLLTAKTRLVRNHFTPGTRALGIALLAAWPLSRMLAHQAMSIRGTAGSQERAKTWTEVWQRRREWLSERSPAAAKGRFAS